MEIIRLGTRRSALAQAQAKRVAEALQRIHISLHVEMIPITTSGDRQADHSDGRRPPPGGVKALFTKELEEALLRREIDLAVHSLKDMASDVPEGLAIGAFPEREDPRDAWISVDGIRFADLPYGARVGTSAVRRQAQLRHLKPGVQIVPMRGNVDTRLQKLKEEELAGIVLAAAGLKRLGRESEATDILSADYFLPAIGQGCLAVECRETDSRIATVVAALDHLPTRQAVLAERSLLRELGGACQTPIAGFAERDGESVHLTAAVISLDGTVLIRDHERAPASDAEALGVRLAQRLLSKGADAILDTQVSGR